MRKFLRRDPMKYPWCIVEASNPKDLRRWADSETCEQAEAWRKNWEARSPGWKFIVMPRIDFDAQRPQAKEEMWECQVCGRIDLKAFRGKVSHHGYERPGDGWQTASCNGARWRPYEVANDAIPPEIGRMEAWILYREELLARVKLGGIPVPCLMFSPIYPESEKNKRFTHPGELRYEDSLRSHIRGLEREIRDGQDRLGWLQRRFDEWRPKVRP